MGRINVASAIFEGPSGPNNDAGAFSLRRGSGERTRRDCSDLAVSSKVSLRRVNEASRR